MLTIRDVLVFPLKATHSLLNFVSGLMEGRALKQLKEDLLEESRTLKQLKEDLLEESRSAKWWQGQYDKILSESASLCVEAIKEKKKLQSELEHWKAEHAKLFVRTAGLRPNSKMLPDAVVKRLAALDEVMYGLVLKLKK